MNATEVLELSKECQAAEEEGLELSEECETLFATTDALADAGALDSLGNLEDLDLSTLNVEDM